MFKVSFYQNITEQRGSETVLLQSLRTENASVYMDGFLSLIINKNLFSFF